MKPKLSKKIGRRGKTVLAVLIAAMFIGTATAALLDYYGSVETTANITQSVLLDGSDWNNQVIEEFTAPAGTTVFSCHNLENKAPVEAPIEFLIFQSGDGTYIDGVVEGIDTTCLTADLQTKIGGEIAEWSTEEVYDGISSVHLDSNGITPGGEGRIMIPLLDTTLGDIDSISWWEYLVAPAGYPPHVDVIIETSKGTDALVFEYAYNGHVGEGQPTYGALTGDWYQTFSDDGNGPAFIDDTAYAWLSSGPAGGPGIIGGTLANWKLGLIDASVDSNTIVLRLEIEIDNWMTETEAYVDNVEINGDLHELEDISGGTILEPGQKLFFFIKNVFAVDLIPGTYLINTKVIPS